jgi:hypothetical protein
MPDPMSFHGLIIWTAIWGGGLWLVFVGIPLAFQ